MEYSNKMPDGEPIRMDISAELLNRRAEIERQVMEADGRKVWPVWAWRIVFVGVGLLLGWLLRG